jgi:hypothetical protein
VYHGDPLGSGVAAGVRSVDTTTRAWTSPTLDGQLYGEPLAFDNRVYVATENDMVYALSAANGAIVWSARLGRPVPAALLFCGDIIPNVGITGTPVIDPARGEIFVVADELVNGNPAHMLTGLNTTTGQVELSQDVDPPGQSPVYILQRTGLTLDDGHVYFGFGGNQGECGTYHGRLVSVPESGGSPRFFTVAARRGESQGAIWMGGGAPAGAPQLRRRRRRRPRSPTWTGRDRDHRCTLGGHSCRRLERSCRASRRRTCARCSSPVAAQRQAGGADVFPAVAGLHRGAPLAG